MSPNELYILESNCNYKPLVLIVQFGKESKIQSPSSCFLEEKVRVCPHLSEYCLQLTNPLMHCPIKGC